MSQLVWVETVEHWGPDPVIVSRSYEVDDDADVHQAREHRVPCRRCLRPTYSVHAICAVCAPTTPGATCPRCAPGERKS